MSGAQPVTTPSNVSPPRLSAVFVSWNRSDLLRNAIRSLQAQNYPALEIIVVDNGSSDGSLEWLREREDVRLIETGRNIGASAARNAGTKSAVGEYVIYMDSDAELATPGALERLTGQMQRDRSLGGISGVFYTDEALTQLWCWSPRMDWEGNHDLPASLQPTPEPAALSTCFCLLRMEPVREAGGFDEFFFYLYEDGDLCERIRKRGWRLAVDPEVRILHRVSQKGRKTFEKIEYHYYHEKLRMYYVLKNWGLRRFLHSWRWKWRNPWLYLKEYDYLPWYCYLDIYGLRAAIFLAVFPWIRWRRRKRWI